MLKELMYEDLSLIREWRNDENVRQVMFTGHIISEKEHLSWWNKVKNDKTQKYFLYYEQGVKYGVVSFSHLDTENISWGFYLSNNIDSARKKIEIWKKIEQEAIDKAFNYYNTVRLEARVFEFNSSVIKMHQRFGFKVVKEEQRMKDGVVCTVVVMILNKEIMPEK